MTRIAPFLTCLLVAVATVGCSRWSDSWVFAPTHTLSATPGTRGLEYDEVRFVSGDGVNLYGWWIPGSGDHPCVVLFHDREGNISGRLDIVLRLHNRLGTGVFLFDYRGYGLSGGVPTDRGLAEDARAARRQVRRAGWSATGEILYGRGLGAAVALASAVEVPSDGVVLEGVFTTLEEAARVAHPVLYRLFADHLRGRFDNEVLIDQLTTPVLFLHGDRDPAPIGMAWKLFDVCNAPKRFHTLHGAGHDDAPFMGGDVYWSAWETFLDDLRHGSSGPGHKAVPGTKPGTAGTTPAPPIDDEHTRRPL